MSFSLPFRSRRRRWRNARLVRAREQGIFTSTKRSRSIPVSSPSWRRICQRREWAGKRNATPKLFSVWVQPAAPDFARLMGRGRRRRPGSIEGRYKVCCRSRHRRASRTDGQDGRWCAGGVRQGRRCDAIRRRGPAQHGRAKCHGAAGQADLHVGDIMIDENDFFGDGVNIAARLESIADSGWIVVSARVYEDSARAAR
jgi:hypothetical protein